MQAQAIEKIKNTLRTCVNCGHAGNDLVANYYRVGGQGDVLVYECQDCLEARWEASKKACEALIVASQHEGVSALC